MSLKFYICFTEQTFPVDFKRVACDTPNEKTSQMGDQAVGRKKLEAKGSTRTRKAKTAKQWVLNKSHAQTEDGHAMIKFDTFQSFWDLSHAVRGCHFNCRKCARASQLSAQKSMLMLSKTHVHASPETSMGK